MALEFLKSVAPPAKKTPDAEVSSDDDSDDNNLTKSAASKIDSERHAESNDASPARKVASDYESEDEQEQDDEIASNPSSSRDSRSPVVFSQHEGDPAPAQSNRSTSPESMTDSEDEHEPDSESDNSEHSDSLEKNQDIEEESDDEAPDEENAKVQVPDSSPTLPRHKPTAKAAGPTPEHQVNSKNHTIERDTSTSTQGEIDQQLTSSMYEVRRSPHSTPKPIPSSSMARPSLKVGASLQALNSRKATLGSSTTRNGPQASQQQSLKEASRSEDESDEDSDDSSTSSDEDSEDDEATARRLASALSRSSQQKSKPEPADSDSESDASGTDSEVEREKHREQMRNDLAKQIAGLSGLDSQKSDSLPGPKVVEKAKPKEEKKKDKWWSGYKFSQPSL